MSLQTYNEEAVKAMEGGNYLEACELLKKAFTHSRNQSDYLLTANNYARCLREIGKPEEAVRLLQKGLEPTVDDYQECIAAAGCMLTLSDIYAQKLDYNLSVETNLKALDLLSKHHKSDPIPDEKIFYESQTRFPVPSKTTYESLRSTNYSTFGKDHTFITSTSIASKPASQYHKKRNLQIKTSLGKPDKRFKSVSPKRKGTNSPIVKSTVGPKRNPANQSVFTRIIDLPPLPTNLFNKNQTPKKENFENSYYGKLGKKVIKQFSKDPLAEYADKLRKLRNQPKTLI